MNFCHTCPDSTQTQPGSALRRPSTLSVALDTTFAGANPTGVGLYSSSLAREIARLAPQAGIRLRCHGPSCPGTRRAALSSTIQEWPVYTQVVLPILLSDRRPHIVHSTSHLGPLLCPGRLVVTVHDLVFRHYPQDYNSIWLAITRAMLPAVLARASAIIADSWTTKQDIRRFYNVPPGKVRVIYPGISEEFRPSRTTSSRIAAVRHKHGLGNQRYILCLGPWVRRKNLGIVIQAFNRISAAISDVSLVLTGSSPPGMKSDNLRALIAGLPEQARERVHTPGFLPASEARALVQGAAVLAYPSRYEGFGLPPIEAMAAGVPVVASDTPAVAESTGGAALLAGVDDLDSWIGALRKVLTQPGLAAQLIEAGAARSRAFSWARCAEETVSLYKSVAFV